MPVRMNSEDAKKLRKLIPLETYPKGAFEELCTNITVEQIQDGSLFQRGDTLPDLVYLLDGSVTLQSEGIIVEVVNSGSDSAKFALAHQIPRKIDAIASGLVRIVRLDPNVVNNPPPIESREDHGYIILEDTDSEADDWLNVMLRLPIFQGLPPINLQKLLMSLKTLQVDEGDVIIEPGTVVETFYVIHKGQCIKARPGVAGGIEKKLTVGDTFGEDNLLLDIPSRESITAISGVTLVQLDKAQFFNLIAKPLLRFIEAEELPDLVSDGLLLLDVRSKQQSEKTPLDSGINIPYLNLATKLNELDNERPVITYADEKTSQAAAFLLLKNNFQVFVLSNGADSAETLNDIEEEVVADIAPVTILTNKHMAKNIVGLELATIEKIEEKAAPTKSLNVEAELKFLRAENQRLTAYVQHLEKKNTKLTLETQQIALRCQAMGLQLNKLKEFLVRYKKNKPT